MFTKQRIYNVFSTWWIVMVMMRFYAELTILYASKDCIFCSVLMNYCLNAYACPRSSLCCKHTALIMLLADILFHSWIEYSLNIIVYTKNTTAEKQRLMLSKLRWPNSDKILFGKVLNRHDNVRRDLFKWFPWLSNAYSANNLQCFSHCTSWLMFNMASGSFTRIAYTP